VTTRQWLKHLLTYGAGLVALNALSFVLLPLYTHSITPADYGVLELLNRSGDVLQMFLAAGLFMATLSFYQHEAGDPDLQRKVFPTALRGVLVIGVISVVALMFVSRPISAAIVGSPEYAWAVNLVLATTLAEVIFQIGILYQQARLRSTTYVALIVARLLFGVLVNIVLVLQMKMGLFGIVIANLAHAAVFAIIAAGMIAAKDGFGFDRVLWTGMLKVGLPLLPGGILMFLLNNADRYVMQATRGPAELGLYALGYKLGKLGIMLIHGPFMKVWGAVMVRLAKQHDGPQRMARITTYYTVVYLTFALALALSGRTLLQWFSPPSYWEATAIIAPILLAHIFWAYSTIADTAFYVTKKTAVKPLLMGIGATVAMGLYLWLIPLYGAMGGAVATLCGFVMLAIVSWVAASRYMVVPYEFGRMFALILLAVASYYLGERWTANGGIPGIVAGIGLSSAFLLVVINSPLTSAVERAELMEGLRSVRNLRANWAPAAKAVSPEKSS
jgi:O-antigen/teichoic acid export membrane protein